MTRFLPAGPMEIGDMATTPLNLPFRQPGNAEATWHEGRAITTLRAVEETGGCRIARFGQRIESVGDTKQFTVNGTGAIDVDLDGRFVTSSTSEWTISGSYSPTGSSSPLQPTPVRATLKVTVTAVE